MWRYKYGEFADSQIDELKKKMRKKIYFLLLCVDPNTKEEYTNINVIDAYDNTLREFGGYNEILFRPIELVTVIALLEAALIEYNSPQFQFSKYRKLVLDAGSEVLRIKEVQ